MAWFNEQSIPVPSDKFFPQRLQKGLEELKQLADDEIISSTLFVFGEPDGHDRSMQYRLSPGFKNVNIYAGKDIDQIAVRGFAFCDDNAWISAHYDPKIFQENFVHAINAVNKHLTEVGEGTADEDNQRQIAATIADLQQGVKEFTMQHVKQQIEAVRAKTSKDAQRARRETTNVKKRFQTMLEETTGAGRERK